MPVDTFDSSNVTLPVSGIFLQALSWLVSLFGSKAGSSWVGGRHVVMFTYMAVSVASFLNGSSSVPNC